MDDLPIEYFENVIDQPDDVFQILRTSLEWIRHPGTPRSEYYVNDVGVPYSYPAYDGPRTYLPQAWTKRLRALQKEAEVYAEDTMEVCLLNMYENSKDQLNWHADDSPEMDDERSIIIMSLGAEREIWFKSQDPNIPKVHKLRLGNGSICRMLPGMQDTHFHRIPKADRQDIGPRISLTFRGFVR